MKWWIGNVECGICEHVQRSKIQIDDEHDEPIIPLECSACGNMTCQSVCDGDDGIDDENTGFSTNRE